EVPLVNRTLENGDRNHNKDVAIHNWQTAWRLTFGLLAISVSFNGYNMLQSKYVPVLFGVDEFGQRIYVGPVTEAKPVDQQRLINRELEDFITNARSISSDPEYQRGMLNEVSWRVRNGTAAAK